MSPSLRRGWCPPESAAAAAEPRDRLLETRQPLYDLDGARAHSHDALDEVDEARGFVGLDVVVVDDPVEAGRVPLSGRSAVALRRWSRGTPPVVGSRTPIVAGSGARRGRGVLVRLKPR